jgi:DNA-binding CsgD family transcriptional regulator
VFPGPFTLDGAEAVAGPGAEAAVLHLVDCSLVVPPRPGADGRPRYGMLETLRAYGTGLLAGAGEDGRAAAALAGYALGVAGEAAAGLQTRTGEVAAARRLDAEDAAMRRALGWAMDRDPAVALRLAGALAPWWRLRGRGHGEYRLLRAAAGPAEAGSDGWCAAQYWLGQIAFDAPDLDGALGHFTAVRDAIGNRGPSRPLAACLGGRAGVLANLGRLAEAVQDGRRSLALARQAGDPALEAAALVYLAVAAWYTDDFEATLQLARQALQVPADIPGWVARSGTGMLAGALRETGDLAAAEHVYADALARTREAGDLNSLPGLLAWMAELDLRAGRMQDAAARLREAVQVITRTGSWFHLANALDSCGYLCAATGRRGEAVTAWAACDALAARQGFRLDTGWDARRHDALRQARQALGPDRGPAAEDRGAAMSRDTAAEFALLLTTPEPHAAAPGLGQLSARERELVILVAQGRTDAQIAAQLHISIRTVSSHLDRIRDKTGCRRRADLTRLALTAGLV